MELQDFHDILFSDSSAVWQKLLAKREPNFTSLFPRNLVGGHVFTSTQKWVYWVTDRWRGVKAEL